jgi:hypothetical protein
MDIGEQIAELVHTDDFTANVFLMPVYCRYGQLQFDKRITIHNRAHGCGLQAGCQPGRYRRHNVPALKGVAYRFEKKGAVRDFIGGLKFFICKQQGQNAIVRRNKYMAVGPENDPLYSAIVVPERSLM